MLTGGGNPGPSRVLALLLLLAVVLSAAAPRVLETFQSRVLRESLAAAPPVTRTINATSGWALTPAAGAPTGHQLAATLPVLRGQLRPPLVAPAGSAWASLTTPPLNVLHPALSAEPGPKTPGVEILYRTPLSSHMRLTGGHLPGATTWVRLDGRQITELQVAVTVATAIRFRLHSGSLIRIGVQPTTASGLLNRRAKGPVQLLMRVTGIMRPTDPGSAFWIYDSLAAAPVLQNATSTDYPGPFWLASAFIGPGGLHTLSGLFPGQVEARLLWEYPLQTSAFAAGQIPAAQTEMRTLNVGQLGQTAAAGYPEQFVINGNLAPLLTAFVAQESAAGRFLSLAITGMFLIGLVLILLAARLLVERRAEEFATLRARGSSLGSLGRRVLADTTPLLAVALASGIAAAVLLTPGGSCCSR